MDRPRLALLDASHGDDDTRRNFRRELDADLAEFDVCRGSLPSTFAFDGVVVTGSRSSVYWDEQWISDLVAWVGDAAARDLPILGVCFGHQVVAEALGGTVEDLGAFEIGYREVEHDGGVLFDGIDDRVTVFTTHGDHVAKLPPGADLLAENDYGVHGFRKGHCFGVQFHPEYDPETAAAITREKDLEASRKQAVLDDITADNYAAACEAKRLFDNYLDYVDRVRDDHAG